MPTTRTTSIIRTRSQMQPTNVRTFPTRPNSGAPLPRHSSTPASPFVPGNFNNQPITPSPPTPGPSGPDGPGDDDPEDPDDNDSDDGDDHTQDNDNPAADDEPAPNLAEALVLVTQELRRRADPPKPKIKAKEPDTFDGSEPSKLSPFIMQCNLYFRNNPTYSDDSSKVTFALSYLRGSALENFETAILEDDYEPWMEDWSVFIQTLKSDFGPIDPRREAADKIDTLKMQDNQRITKYNIAFKKLSSKTGWDEAALSYRYYTGLPDRIKDAMAQRERPSSLAGLRELAQNLDARHWERQHEKSRSDKSQKNPAKSDSSASSDKKAFPSSNKSSNQSSSKTPPSSAKPAKSGTSAPLSDKLGKDGKLTPAERQRRFDNKLCMFCGGVGHIAKDCAKSSSSAAKARAASTQPKN